MKTKKESPALDPEEECEMKWRRWKNYLQGIIFYLKHSSHTNNLTKFERLIVENWAKHFCIQGGNLLQNSLSLGRSFIPVTSYMECFKRISDCHISTHESSGQIMHRSLRDTLAVALEGHIWPGAEDDAYDFLKLCFHCQEKVKTEGKAAVIAACDLSYKEDLPLCFAAPSTKPLCFSGENVDDDDDEQAAELHFPTAIAGTTLGLGEPSVKVKKSKGLEIPGKSKIEKNKTKPLLSKLEKNIKRKYLELNVKKKGKKTADLHEDPKFHPGDDTACQPDLSFPVDDPATFAMDTSIATDTSVPSFLPTADESEPKRQIESGDDDDDGDLMEDIEWFNGLSGRSNRGDPPAANAQGDGIDDDPCNDVSATCILERPKVTLRYRPMFGILCRLGSSIVNQTVVEEFAQSTELLIHPDDDPEKNKKVECMMARWKEMGGAYQKSSGHLQTPSLKCQSCMFVAANHAQLSDHQMFGNFTGKKFGCCLCSFSSKEGSEFASHMTATHRVLYDSRLVDSHLSSRLRKLVEYENLPNFELASNCRPRTIHSDIPMLMETEDEGEGDILPDSGTDPAESQPARVQDDFDSCKSAGLSSEAEIFPQIYNHLCEICCVLLMSRTDLECHLYILHKIYLPHFPVNSSTPPSLQSKPHFPCRQCGDLFWSHTSLTLHQDFVHGSPAIEAKLAPDCQLCKKTPTDIFEHLLKHHISMSDMFLTKFCAICMEALSCPRSFETHMLTAHKHNFPNRQTLYLAVFGQPTEGNLPQDLLVAIENLKDHSCSAALLSIMDEKITDESRRRKYVPSRGECDSSEREDESLHSTKVECTHCGCRFDVKEEFVDHTQRYHRMKCSGCDLVFPTRRECALHIETEHPSGGKVVFSHAGIIGSTQVADLARFHVKDCDECERKLGPSRDDDFCADDATRPVAGPSYWTPDCPRPKGKIPTYAENSNGEWLPLGEVR